MHFCIPLIAGLSTGIGGLIAFFTKQTNTKFLSVILGFSAGVMIYISFVEILAEAFTELQHLLGSFQGSLITIVSFFAGIGLIMLIDRFVPCYENPHEIKRVRRYYHLSKETQDGNYAVQKNTPKVFASIENKSC